MSTEQTDQNPPRRAGHDSQDWIDRCAADIRDLNPDYHDFEAEVAKIIRAASSPKPTEPIDKQRVGLYNKFTVRRTDGSDATGGKHDGCNYFVLDLTHDPHAIPALRTYADACRADYPLLARDLDSLVPSSSPGGASLAALQQELASIDAVMARRPALDQPTRWQNIEKAITMAGKADEAIRLIDSEKRKLALAEQRLAEVEGQCRSFRDAYDRESQWRATAEQRLAEVTRHLTEEREKHDEEAYNDMKAAKEAAEATIATLCDLMNAHRLNCRTGGPDPDAALAAPAAGTPTTTLQPIPPEWAAAANSAKGLCESEANRWERASPATAEHWRGVARQLGALYLTQDHLGAGTPAKEDA